VSSDDDFLALRRFDRAHCRLLLRLQDQAAELEEKLDSIDDRLSQRDAKDVDNGSVRKDTVERKNILDQLQYKLSEYGPSGHPSLLELREWLTKHAVLDELLCRYSELKSRPKASRTSIKNIQTWLSNNNGPICPCEVESFNSSDLITMAKSPKSSVRRLIEQYLLVPTRGLFGLLLRAPVSGRQGANTFQMTIQGNDEQVDSLASVMIFVSATAMLIAPL
jgi:hypothetical protein